MRVIKNLIDLMERYKSKLLDKEVLTKTLRAFQTSSNAMKSKERDEARAFLQEFGTLSIGSKKGKAVPRG